MTTAIVNVNCADCIQAEGAFEDSRIPVQRVFARVTRSKHGPDLVCEACETQREANALAEIIDRMGLIR